VLYFYENGVDIRKMPDDMYHYLEMRNIEVCKRYITFYEKIQKKIRDRAQKKIYFWWIPICYDTTRDCGKRMMIKNWENTQRLLCE
jgi:hypothetical protein